MRLRRSIAAMVALCLLFAAFAAQAASKTVYVKANTVKVYTSASTSSKGLGTMNFGEAMGLIKRSGDWAKVTNESGAVGYCKYSALTTKNPNGAEKTYYAKSAGVTANYRTSATSAQMATFAVNDPVSVVAMTADKKWFRVKLDNSYGFVQCSRLSKAMVEVPTTVYITANTATIYKSKSTSSQKLGSMSYGESLTRLKTESGWALIQNAGGKTGYVKASMLSTVNPNGDAETWYTSTAAILRAMPSASAKKLTALDQGDSLDVVAATADGKWVRAEVGGVYGYIESAKLTDNVPRDNPDPNPSYNDEYRGTANVTIERVIALAVQQYGKKYVYATSGPNTYDCSGLTCYCFSKEAGVSLKRSAYAQGYDGRFQKIESVEALRRGDIVCFDTVSSDVDISDHVGIYLGGGKFIHASSGAGQVVVSPITAGYYNRQFSWGLRILD